MDVSCKVMGSTISIESIVAPLATATWRHVLSNLSVNDSTSGAALISISMTGNGAEFVIAM